MALAKNEKIKEVVEHYIVHGLEQTCQDFNLQESTIKRYQRHYENTLGINIDKNKILLKLSEKYSSSELNSILKGLLITTKQRKENLNFDGEEITFCHMTDTHIGSVYFKDYLLESALEYSRLQKNQTKLNSQRLLRHQD